MERPAIGLARDEDDSNERSELKTIALQSFDQVKVRNGGINLGIDSCRDGCDDQVAQGKTATRCGEAATKTRVNRFTPRGCCDKMAGLPSKQWKWS